MCTGVVHLPNDPERWRHQRVFDQPNDEPASRDQPSWLTCKVVPSFRCTQTWEGQSSRCRNRTRAVTCMRSNEKVWRTKDGLTFSFRAPTVCNDNENVITLKRDSDRVGRKIWAKGCGEDVVCRLRLKRQCHWWP